MQSLISLVRKAWSTRDLRDSLDSSRLQAPARILSMMMSEPNEYTARAILAVNTRGE